MYLSMCHNVIYIALVTIYIQIILCESGSLFTLSKSPADTQDIKGGERVTEYSNDVVIEFSRIGFPEALEFATRYRLILKCQVFENHPIYHFECPSPCHELKHLQQHPEIIWMERQRHLKRKARRSLGFQPQSWLSYRLEPNQKLQNIPPETLETHIYDSFILKTNNYLKDKNNEIGRRKLELIKNHKIIKRILKTGLNREKSKQTITSPFTSTKNESIIFNDPQFHKQWYLVNQVGYDLNVTSLWKMGITGKGVTVSVLDDGIQSFHPEIAHNFSPEVSFSLIDDSSPIEINGTSTSNHKVTTSNVVPDFLSSIIPTGSNHHGTFCAGIVAGVANNGICGVGVAYDSKIGGVRLINEREFTADVKEAIALTRHLQEVSIFSSSWGPPDDGESVEGPGRLATMALQKGTAEGRQGKGIVYIWASGNGGYHGDNCNLDGYVSSVFTLSVSSITRTGLATAYSEPCASTLASVFVEETELQVKGDLKRSNPDLDLIGGVVVPTLDGGCDTTFHGSSAAAPLAAGVVALLLQANPSLSYRDVQHLIVMTSEPTPEALSEGGWTRNKAGKWFHLKQGFGPLNAGRLVSLSSHWVNVPPVTSVTLSRKKSTPRQLENLQWTNLTFTCVEEKIRKIEHVILRSSIRGAQRGRLNIYIISPQGTESQVLTERPNDNSLEGFDQWDFVTVHFWGENPTGCWTASFYHRGPTRGVLLEADIIIRGMG